MKLYMFTIIRLLLIVFLAPSFLYSLSYNFFPTIKLKHAHNGHDWVVNNDNLSITSASWGIGAIIKFNNIEYRMDVDHSIFFGSNIRPSEISSFQSIAATDVMHGLEIDKNYFFYNHINAFIHYEKNNLDIMFGKYKSSDLIPINSIFISDRSPSYPTFEFIYDFKDKPFRFRYRLSSLKSNIKDENYIDVDITNKRIHEIDRYMSIHSIEYKYKKWFLEFSEAVIYSNRGIDMNYLIPAPYHSLQGSRGDFDNLIINFNFSYNYKNYMYYGSILIDELSPLLIFKKENRNWVAYQFGIKKNNLIWNDIAIVEFSWIDHRVYRHRFPYNDFYNYGYPVGFWAGPHSDQIEISYKIYLENISLIFNYLNLRRGEITNSMIQNQYSTIAYERFSTGILEQKESFTIALSTPISKSINFTIKGCYLNWENAGFKQYIYSNSNQIDDLKNINNKSSVIIDLSYNL